MNPPPLNVRNLEPPLPAGPPAPAVDRLVLQLHAVHEHCCEAPLAIGPHYTEVLKTIEQPWVRRVWVGPVWAALDFGWLTAKANISRIIIVNNTGKGNTANPTDIEQVAIDSAWVHVCEEGRPGWLVGPRGDFFVGRPAVITGLGLMCPTVCEVMLYVIPR